MDRKQQGRAGKEKAKKERRREKGKV